MVFNVYVRTYILVLSNRSIFKFGRFIAQRCFDVVLVLLRHEPMSCNFYLHSQVKSKITKYLIPRKIQKENPLSSDKIVQSSKCLFWKTNNTFKSERGSNTIYYLPVKPSFSKPKILSHIYKFILIHIDLIKMGDATAILFVFIHLPYWHKPKICPII